MNTLDQYDYDLPPDRIAQAPKNPREDAKLMVVPKNLTSQGVALEHKHIRDLPDFLHPTDVLVINNTKVFKARLIGTVKKPDGATRTVELFLLRPDGKNWQALAKPGKHVSTGNIITIAHNFSC